MQIELGLEFLKSNTSIVHSNPHPEGNNVNMWIGFKHVMYLAEQAIHQHFKNAGLSFTQMFEELGLVMELVHNSGRFLHALKMDDEAEIVVAPAVRQLDGCLSFTIKMFVSRDGKKIKNYTGKVRVVLKRDNSLKDSLQTERDISPLAPYITDIAGLPGEEKMEPIAVPEGANVEELLPVADKDADRLVWKFYVPYFYSHGNQRLKMSGYERLMEEAADRYVAQRGISVANMLKDRNWIPVVPTADINILDEVFMGEDLYIVYQCENVVKDFTYACGMDCYVVRQDKLIHVSTGSITHGYAEIYNRVDWALVSLDEQLLTAVRG